MKFTTALLVLLVVLNTPRARGATVQLGSLSYDTFLPASSGSPGVFAFNLSNFTGAFSLPPDFPVTDSLIFQSASLRLAPSGQSAQVINLGNIGPGFLLDVGGNPVVQVPGDQLFTSAEFIAVLSPTTFTLSGGSTFMAGSAFIDVLLLPSSGPTLSVDVDQSTIAVAGAPATGVPEPGPVTLVLAGLLWLVFRECRRPSRQWRDYDHP